MSDTPISPREAWLELFLAWSALEALKPHGFGESRETDDQPLVGQSITDRISRIEASLGIIRDFIAQQDPNVRAR